MRKTISIKEIFKKFFLEFNSFNQKNVHFSRIRRRKGTEHVPESLEGLPCNHEVSGTQQ